MKVTTVDVLTSTPPTANPAAVLYDADGIDAPVIQGEFVWTR
jgi:predicted PhzF superfamily epimerase YddE/YHI9